MALPIGSPNTKTSNVNVDNYIPSFFKLFGIMVFLLFVAVVFVCPLIEKASCRQVSGVCDVSQAIFERVMRKAEKMDLPAR